MRVLIRALAPAALPLLAACSTVSGHDRTAAVGESLTLRPGESAAVADAGMLVHGLDDIVPAQSLKRGVNRG